MPKVVGIIFKHSDDTYSVWGGDLKPNSSLAIEAIVEQHRNDGASVRGRLNELNLQEVVG